MATSQTDLEQIIAAMKNLPPPAYDVHALRPLSQASKKREPRPPKPEPGRDPLTENIAFADQTADLKSVAGMLAETSGITYQVSLDKPILISQAPPLNLDQFPDYRIQPFSSWARLYLYVEGTDASTTLYFDYLWTNEGQYSAIVDIEAPIIVTGTVFGRGSAGFFGGHTTTVFAHIHLFPMRWIGWGTNPINGAPLDRSYFADFQLSQAASVASFSPKGGWGFGSATSAYQSFDNQQFIVSKKTTIVPAGASLVFRIQVRGYITTEGNTLEDQAWVDFGSNGNFLSSPHIKLNVWTLA
jgi:hypothetical protein